MTFLAFGEGGWRNGSLSSQWQSTYNNTGRTWEIELARKICEITGRKERWSNRTNIRDRQNLKWNVADCSSRLRFYLDRNYQDGKEKWEYFCECCTTSVWRKKEKGSNESKNRKEIENPRREILWMLFNMKIINFIYDLSLNFYLLIFL